MVNLESSDSSNAGKNLSSLTVKLNGNCHRALKVSAFNGNGTAKVPAKERPLTNGSCSKASVNGISTFKVPAANGVPTVNESSYDKVKTVLTNGNSSEKETVNGNRTVNGKLVDEVQTVEVCAGKGKLCDSLPAEEVPLVNGNCNDKDSGNHLNGSDTPSESGSSSISHISDSLYNEDYSDDNQDGFTEVVRRSRNKNKNSKNQRKKIFSNQPPGLAANAQNIRHDNVKDKKRDEKTSPPVPLSQKTPAPSRNFSDYSPKKSYSLALKNGQNRNSEFRNGDSRVSSGTPNLFNCSIPNKSLKNCDSSRTCVSISQSSADQAKTVVINDTLAVSCKQKSLPTKVEMTDVSAQTDLGSEKEISTCEKECLPSKEVHNEPEKASSPIDSVESTDCVEEITDGSSIAAYCESVESNDSGRGDSEVTYDNNNPYCCEFPRAKASQLIGKGGSFKKRIERETGIKLWVMDDMYNSEQSIIQMTGPGEKIDEAKRIISQRFPNVQLKQWLGFPDTNLLIPLSEHYYATLPEFTEFLGIVSSICNPSWFWLLQYGNPSYHALEGLEKRMANHFNNVTDAPGVDNPTAGHVVAVPNGIEKWVRGEITDKSDDGQIVSVQYLDHGGIYDVPVGDLRPMRNEFLILPFLASRCCLYGAIPTGQGWSQGALAEFTRLCDSPPKVMVVQNTPETYFVKMLGYDDELKAYVDVAKTLVDKGLAVSYDSFQPEELVAEVPHEVPL